MCEIWYFLFIYTSFIYIIICRVFSKVKVGSRSSIYVREWMCVCVLIGSILGMAINSFLKPAAHCIA